jgi:Rrf2 family cysteine metabolism transcriptional repressor
MKVSTRLRYGLRFMVDLATNYKKGPVLLKDIAKCERISKKYLEQIVITLRTAGLISAIRGSKGGYFLTKPPDKIKLTYIFQILEGTYAPVECVINPAVCTLLKTCPTRQLWIELSRCIEESFRDKTLADLINLGKNHSRNKKRH